MSNNPFDQVYLPQLEMFEKMMAELEEATLTEQRLREMLSEVDKVIATSNPVGALADVAHVLRERVTTLLTVITGGTL